MDIEWVVTVLVLFSSGQIIYRALAKYGLARVIQFLKGEASTIKKVTVGPRPPQKGVAWIRDALRPLGIDYATTRVAAAPDFTVALDVEKRSTVIPLSDEYGMLGADETPVYGDRYRIRVQSNTAVFAGIALRTKQLPLQTIHTRADASFFDVYTLSCESAAALVLFTPRVRDLLMQSPPLEIEDGRLFLPLLQAMELPRGLVPGAQMIRRQWEQVVALLGETEVTGPIGVRLFLTAALDPEPWFRRRAASFLPAYFRADHPTEETEAEDEAAKRQTRVAEMADLPPSDFPVEPRDLFEAVRPLLHHPSGQPALFASACDTSPQSHRTIDRLKAGTVGQADLFPEGWLVAALLFPEQALAGPLLRCIPHLPEASAFLVEALLDSLSAKQIDQLMVELLAHPALRVLAIEREVGKAAHRLDQLAAMFFESDDVDLQYRILSFFVAREDERLPALVQRALPHILATPMDPGSTERLVVVALRGLTDVGELSDLDAIHRSRRYCTKDESRHVHDVCRSEVLRRGGVSDGGLLSLVPVTSDRGSLSVTNNREGELTRLATSPKVDG